jgi:N utilization substance protein B
MLYQWDMTRDPMDKVATLFWRVRSSTEDTQAMAERLARGAQLALPELDKAIGDAATNWRFDRIAAVDRNILRIAAYELLKEPATPPGVVIDEAVEIAKRFGEGDSPAFVNGVLDAVKRASRGEAPRAKKAAAKKRPRGPRE